MSNPFPPIPFFGDLGTSIIRSLTPIIAGIVVSFAIRYGFEIDEAEVTAWLTPVLSGAWYVVFRIAERIYPRLGWFLGKPAAPSYTPPALASHTTGTNS